MARPKSSKPAPPPPESPLKTGYLVLYNTVSCLLWSVVLARTAVLYATQGLGAVYPAIGEYTKWTQTLAVLEIIHALLGIVRAPVATTTMQVSSRLLLVWAIVHPFPHLARTHTPYASMLLAWSASEVIRYAFFALSKAAGAAPAWLVWLRYSAFAVLYPAGISSECLMMWAAVPVAVAVRPGLEWVLYVVLAAYVPGSYVLFTHMMSQRRKVLGRGGAKKTR